MAWNPKLKISLGDVFNRVYGSKPYEVRKTLRQLIYRSSFQDDFGLRAIDVIVERTLKGKDKDGQTFAAYSSSYRESDTFEIYKAGQRRVDLKLSGEMLASMQVKGTGSGNITINFVDELNAAKAHGHITGMSGRKGGVVRDFFGISDMEADGIMKDLVSEYARGDAIEAEARALIRDVVG